MKSTYKNKQSIVVENAIMRAEFTPDPGGKMVSLIRKDSGYEYLVQRPAKLYLDQPFDGLYTDGECSGFDDMFPTIDACLYHKDPWKGIKMADHGEVWSLPWTHEVKNDVLSFQVSGVRFPYTLKKTIFFTDTQTLRLSYTLLNNSPASFDFLWAGHFMLNMEEGTRLVVPEDCRAAVSILTNTERPYGEIMNWPDFIDQSGQHYPADISRPASSKGFEKYYFRNQLKDGWCMLKYPNNDKSLKIAFSADTVPYLGILMNEKGWDNLYNIFIEPCTVCYDRPDLAESHGQISTVKGNGTYEWYVDLTI